MLSGNRNDSFSSFSSANNNNRSIIGKKKSSGFFAKNSAHDLINQSINSESQSRGNRIQGSSQFRLDSKNELDSSGSDSSSSDSMSSDEVDKIQIEDTEGELLASDLSADGGNEGNRSKPGTGDLSYILDDQTK